MEEKNSYLSADPETIRQIDEKMPPEEELPEAELVSPFTLTDNSPVPALLR